MLAIRGVLIVIRTLFQQGKDMVSYIQNELEALEREQKQIDKQAALLEKDLRQVMEAGTFCCEMWRTGVCRRRIVKLVQSLPDSSEFDFM